MTAGTHLIIELKRAERVVGLSELLGQVMKYAGAMEKVLSDIGNRDSYQIICVLGKPVDNRRDSSYREKVNNTLSSWNARVVYYGELIENAQKAYQEYLNAHKNTQPLFEIMNQLDIGE